MPFIWAKSIMERTVYIILHSFRCWEPWAVQHQPGLWSRCSMSRRSCPWKNYTILVTQAITGFSYKETTPYIVSTAKQKGCSHENLLQHFQIKGRPRRGYNRGYQAGAARRLLWYNQSGKFIPWTHAAPCGPGGQAGQAAQHKLSRHRPNLDH